MTAIQEGAPSSAASIGHGSQPASLSGGTLTFPDFGNVSIDQERAETFGLMTINQSGRKLECEVSQNGHIDGTLRRW